MSYFGENWDDNDFPLAYLITVRTYGTWLHGEERGSVDTHHGYNVIGSEKRPPSEKMLSRMMTNMKDPPMILDDFQWVAVKEAIEEVCRHREYQLYALNVRTNHFHVVTFADQKPELMANSFKSHATRELRRRGLIGSDTKVWARGRSRRYLWKENHVNAAIDYVLYSQGLMDFEKWYEEKYPTD